MTKDGQSNWNVYIKLFILMGVGCGFLILTPFIDNIILWILIIITTAGQGIYISLVSILNSQVLNYLIKKFPVGTSKSGDKTSERPTQESTLSSSHVKYLAKPDTISMSSNESPQVHIKAPLNPNRRK